MANNERLSQSLYGIVFLLAGAILTIVSCCDDDCYYDDDDDVFCHTHDGYYHCHSNSGHNHLTRAEVAILLTDAPHSDLQSVFVTVTKIQALSREFDPQVVYSSKDGHRVDLLELRGDRDTRVYDLLVSPAEVQPATYEALVFQFREPEIVLANGDVIKKDQIDLAAGGKIEINLRAPLPLAPGDLSFLLLDFDVRRSISQEAIFQEAVSQEASEDPIEATGAPRWRIQPLLFVEAARENVGDFVRTPTDVSGRIRSLDREALSYAVTLSDERGIVGVVVHEEAMIVDQDMQPVDFESVQKNSPATIRGRMGADGQLVAETILIGQSSQVTGVVSEIRDVSLDPGEFDSDELNTVQLDVDLLHAGTLGEGARRVTVHASRDTRISIDRTQPAELGDLQVGDRINLTGSSLIYTNSTKAVMIDLKSSATETRPEQTPESVIGTVSGIDGKARSLTVKSDGQLVSVEVAQNAAVVLLQNIDGRLVEETIPLDELDVGMPIQIEVEPARGTTAEAPVSRFLIVNGDASSDPIR